MPGSANIFGLVPCSNPRTVDDDKPRTITFDAELVVGFEGKVVKVTSAVLTHFCGSNEPPFVNSALYVVRGRIASVPKNFDVGKGYDVSDYDFLIDADQVCASSFSLPSG